MKTIYNCTLALCLVGVVISPLRAQLPSGTPAPTNLPDPPYAIITYPSTATQSVSVVSPCAGGVFGLVGLQPDQVVQVVVHYSASQALQVVNLQARDGGMILPPSSVSTAGTSVSVTNPLVNQIIGGVGVPLPATPQASSFVISADGTLSFTFQATHDPGRNQITLRQATQILGLQFWVFDPTTPQNNPSAITPANPNPSE